MVLSRVTQTVNDTPRSTDEVLSRATLISCSKFRQPHKIQSTFVCVFMKEKNGCLSYWSQYTVPEASQDM